jgi:hypothetical protein
MSPVGARPPRWRLIAGVAAGVVLVAVAAAYYVVQRRERDVFNPDVEFQAEPPAPAPAAPPPGRKSDPTGIRKTGSTKTELTRPFDLIRAGKSVAAGETASAPIALKSVTTLPPAWATAACICGAVVPFVKRTIVIPKGFRSLFADAGAATPSAATATSRGRSRFTALRSSARRRRSLITRWSSNFRQKIVPKLLCDPKYCVL